MRALLFLLLLPPRLVLGGTYYADNVASSRYVDWIIGTNVGVRGGIPTTYTKHGSTLSAGSSTATIQSALDAAAAAASAGAGKYVEIGAGTTTLTDNLAVGSYVELRGVGASTILAMTVSGTGSIIDVSGSESSEPTAGTITAGYSKGSTSITISGGTTPSTGDFISIYQDDETWVFDPDGGAYAHVSAIYRCENVSGSTVTIWPPLMYSSSGFNPKYVKVNGTWVKGAGVSNMTINPSGSCDVDKVLNFHLAYGCWAENIVINEFPGSAGMYGIACLGCEWRHCDEFGASSNADSYGFQGNRRESPGGWGISACAIYNCIFSDMFHGVMLSGQNGCVVAYNFSRKEHYSDNFPFNYQTAGLNSTHAAEGMMTLWEGNYTNHVWADDHHGGCAYQTWYRNRCHGVSEYAQIANGHESMIRLSEGSYRHIVIGNVLGDSSWTSDQYEWSVAEWASATESNAGGMWWLGPDDSGVTGSIIRLKNYNYHDSTLKNDTTQTTSGTLEDSLCFSAKPSWWGNCTWPPFDPTNPKTRAQILADPLTYGTPAVYRYVNGTDPPTSSPAVGARRVGPASRARLR